MAGILEAVNKRTQLVGENRLELLLFKLGGKQKYGINVFKVREVLQCPGLTSIPQQHPFIKGVAHIRGQTISVIDMALATGGEPVRDLANSFIIIAEYNRSTQGFLVSGVERIINMNWDEILPPPQGANKGSYLTAVTEIDKELVEIIDVEKVLNEIMPISTDLSVDVRDKLAGSKTSDKAILIADDSSVARNQVKRALDCLGLEMILANDGKDALDKLREIAQQYDRVSDRVALVISDIEMPEMDGYTLTAEIRNADAMRDLHVILHTSLSGVFNEAMVKKVGANQFIPKFNPDELATAVQEAVGQ